MYLQNQSFYFGILIFHVDVNLIAFYLKDNDKQFVASTFSTRILFINFLCVLLHGKCSQKFLWRR